MGPRWTDERVDELTNLWVRGHSASIIAGAMGITRNAVIGKANRLGLPPHEIVERKPRASGNTGKRVTTPRRRPTTRAARSKFEGYSVHSRAQRIVRSRLVMAELFNLNAITDLPPDQSPIAKTIPEMIEDRSECRWPVDPPPNAESSLQYFCACDVVEGRPYCARHCAVAYRDEFQKLGDVVNRVVENLGRRDENPQAA